MAALPTTGISTSLVAQTLGAGSNDVGTLFCHENVNEYGFNNPDVKLQNAIWGLPASERARLSPNNINPLFFPGVEPGYPLHAFRGYDHLWKAYALEGFGMTGNEYYKPLVFVLGLKTAIPKHESIAEPSPAIDHIFKIVFSRHAEFTKEEFSSVLYLSEVVNYPSFTFQIDALNPPDKSTNGVLQIGSTFYIQVIHLSSPDRRWAEPENLVSDIYSFVVPGTAYTGAKNIQNLWAFAVRQTSPTTVNIFQMSCDLFADFATVGSAIIKADMSINSSFEVDSYTLSKTVNIPKNDNPGTPTLVGKVEFDFSTSGIHHSVSAGNTLYCRFSVNGNIINTITTTVLGTAPLQ